MKHTEETKRKISESVKHLWTNPEYKENCIAKLKEYKFTDKHKENLKKAKINNPTKYWAGKIRNDNTKQKMSESHNIFWKKNPELKKDMIVIHHINGNHYDNRPENRKELTNSEHTKLHWDQGDIRNGKTKLKMEVT